MQTIVLSEQEIAGLLPMERVLDGVQRTYHAHGTGGAIVPAKITLDLSRGMGEGWMNAMPAYVIPEDAAGIKFAGGFALNPTEQDLPYIMGTILLISPRTGSLLAIMGGQYITTARTGASAAIAAGLLAPSAEIAAIIGLGAVGRSAAVALDQTLHSLREIRVVDTSQDALDSALGALRVVTGAEIQPMATPTAAVDDADVIVTATHSSSPLFAKRDLKPESLVVTLGSLQELDEDTVMTAGARIVDHLEQNKHRGEFHTYFESGRLSDEDVYAEIGEVVAGRKPPPKLREGGCVASLIGVGSHDVALAKVAYECAVSREDIGAWVEL